MAILCCSYECKNRGRHKFPKSVELTKKWLNALNKVDFQLTVNSRVCSDHFLDSDYGIRTPKNSGAPNQRKILKKGVVPSVFYWPSNLKINEPLGTKKLNVPEMQLHSIGPTISLKNVFLNDTLGADGEKGSKEIKIKIKKEENEDCADGEKGSKEIKIKIKEVENEDCGFTVDETDVMIKQEDDICDGIEVIEVEMEKQIEDHKEIYPVSLPHNPQGIERRRSQRIRPVKKSWSPSIQRKSTPLRRTKKISPRLLKKNKKHLRKKSCKNHFLSIEKRSFYNLKERMRRSEINELYDDLRQQLQLKTPKVPLSKRFIMFKAVSCIRNLKYEARQLTNELSICRQKHSKLFSQLSELKLAC